MDEAQAVTAISVAIIALGGLVLAAHHARADVDSTGISAVQDQDSQGFDSVSYWDNPTTGWDIKIRFWDVGYSPSGVLDSSGGATYELVTSGTAATSNDPPAGTNYGAQSYLTSVNINSGTVRYTYRNRNQKTALVEEIRWTTIFSRNIAP